MNHNAIIEWAKSLNLSIQETTQGHPTNGWPVTLLTGQVDDPLETSKSVFDEPQRKYIPEVVMAGEQVVYGFDDERVILSLVLTDNDDDNHASWMHIMLYSDDETYQRGWESQSPTIIT